ncbi:hypothetical protein Tco_0257002 [Tanacetum coccineum]
MLNINERVYNQQSQIESVYHQALMFHQQLSQVIHPQTSHMIHPQSSQVTHLQSSQAPAIYLQSSAAHIQSDSGLVVLFFLPTDDPLECINKALAFMCTILASIYPSTNNQLETSSNPMNQVDMQERKTHSYMENVSQVVHNTPSSANQDSIIMSVIEQMSNQVAKCNAEYNENQIINESLTAKLERYKERIKTFEQRLNVDLNSREKMIDSQIDDMIKEKLALKQQIDSLEQNLSNQIQEKESLLQTFTVFKNESKEKKKAQQIKPTLYDGSVISRKHDVISVTDEEETLILEELNKLSEDFRKHFVPQKKLSAEQAFWLPLSNSNSEQPNVTQTPVRVEVPKELPKKGLKLENDRLLEHIICQDVMNIVMHADVKFDNMLPVPNTFLDDNIALDMMKTGNDRLNSLTPINDYKSMEINYIEEYDKNLELAAELSQMNELSKTCSRLEQRSQLQAKDTTISNLKKHIQELKGKSVADCSEYVSKSKEIALVVHKFDLEPLSLKLKNNREAHVDYIRITKENADTLRDIVEQASISNPLDNASSLKSEKLVTVTPMNKARKVTFAKTSATSDNNTQKQVDVHKTQTTIKPLVPSTIVKCSTNASKSKPQRETKNTRIMQPLSSNLKYQRVEAHTRNAKSSLDKGNSMSKYVCSTCKKCLFDANHDLCVVNYLSDVNAHVRAKSVKSIKKKEWKTTGKMFKNVRYKWVTIGRTFTLVGNKCPLPRFTSTKIVPPRKPVKSTVIKNIKPSSASQWRPRETKHVCSSSEPRIVKARTTNHLEPNNNRDSNVSISLCSSSIQCRPCSSTSKLLLSTSAWNSVLKKRKYFNPTPCVVSPMLPIAAPLPADITGTPSSTTIDQDVPYVSTSPTTYEIQAPIIHQGVEEQIQGIQSVEFDNAPLIYNLTLDSSS